MKNKISHLEEQQMGYWEHWWRAIRIALALLIHAFLPNVLTDYASRKLSDD